MIRRLLCKILNILAFPIFIICIGPARAIRIVIRSSLEVAAFRKWYKREPTEQEWQEIANRVGNEVLKSR